MKCTSRFSLCDMGWHECQLPLGHKGSHKHKVKKGEDYTKIGYTLTWPKDKYKDLNVSTDWLRENTNLFEIIDKEINNFKDYFSGYEIDDTGFNDPIYGDRFSLHIYLQSTGELREAFDEKEFNLLKYNEVNEKYFINKYGKFEEYQDIEWDFQSIVIKQIKPNLDKYKLYIHFDIV